MKAIAKLLPVTIMTLHENSGARVEKVQDSDYILKTETHKLFAVTYDIMIDDEVVLLNDLPVKKLGDKAKVISVNKDDSSIISVMFDDDVRCDLVWKGFFGKVIGEISPKAIWVRDGDEIVIGELEVHCGILAGIFSTEDLHMHLESPDTDKIICLIQCPTCNTFH